MIATYSPRAIVKLTPRSASTLTSPSEYVFVTSSMSIARRVSFIAESLDGIERGGAPSGIGAERERHDGREAGRDDDAAQPRDRRDHAGDLHDREVVDQRAERDAEQHPDQTPERRERERLDEELQQYLEAGRADRLAQADLASSLGDADQHDVEDPDPRDQQRDRADQRDDERDGAEDPVDRGRERLAVERLVLDVPALDALEPRQRVGLRLRDLRGVLDQHAHEHDRPAPRVLALVRGIRDRSVGDRRRGQKALGRLRQHADDRVAELADASIPYPTYERE